MIDHISLAVGDLGASGDFYQHVLEPLRYARLLDRPDMIGFGIKYPEFWLNLRRSMSPLEEDTGIHVCLRATSIDAVQEFYGRALKRGGRSDGAPGPRHGAMLIYFAAFIRDIDGNKIEVMTVPHRAVAPIGSSPGGLIDAAEPEPAATTNASRARGP